MVFLKFFTSKGANSLFWKKLFAVLFLMFKFTESCRCCFFFLKNSLSVIMIIFSLLSVQFLWSRTSRTDLVFIFLQSSPFSWRGNDSIDNPYLIRKLLSFCLNSLMLFSILTGLLGNFTCFGNTLILFSLWFLGNKWFSPMNLKDNIWGFLMTSFGLLLPLNKG